ncbi:hypothetical protein [Haloferula sp. BvORR071]|uniref:hypothetical protein n=1 Tax=Haloferula sp. BvORR071 TaxID=1396141 RepID=UPI00055054F6|nr:hypothetical protein [Haloferula sp. BvORR071]
MPLPEETLKRHWLTAGSSELWGTRRSYSAIEYERLPPLDSSLRAAFEWLSDLPDRDYFWTLENEENRIDGLKEVEEQIDDLGLLLPLDFLLFFTQAELRNRVPSCTGCFLGLSEEIVPFPDAPGCHALRFMNDSQHCVMWYLLFQPDLPPRVISSEYFIEPDLFEEMDYEWEGEFDEDDDEIEPLPYEEILSDIYICAESFGEFIHRFCIENTIWYALHDELPLAQAELDYINAAKASKDGTP